MPVPRDAPEQLGAQPPAGSERDYLCGRCGYGVSRREPPERCPMCHGSDWSTAVRFRSGAPRETWEPSYADRGLLLALLELFEATGRAQATEAIAEEVGIPETLSPVIEGWLERNRAAGLVERGADGLWQPTGAGISAAASKPRRDKVGDVLSP
jgi:hypothetical protein